jgi:CRP-like cAMP-binding protein
VHGLDKASLTRRWNSPIIERLRRHVELSADDIDACRALIQGEMAVGKRRDLVVDGYEFSKLCFIRTGFAARYKVLRNGKRQIISVMLPGDVVGMPGSFLQQATFSVIALTEMKLEVCALDDFLELCHRRPKLGLALAWLAVEESILYAERIVDIGRRSSIERLAHFLIELHGRLAVVGLAGERGFELSFSQEVISDALGLSVPHLNRMLARLRADGAIRMTDGQIEFTDLKALHLLAQYNPAKLLRIPASSKITAPKEMTPSRVMAAPHSPVQARRNRD